MILLDTSVVIELMDMRGGQDVCFANLQRYPMRKVHISAITIFEFEAGLIDGSPGIKARKQKWSRFYELLTYELVTDGVASDAARIVRDTAKHGHQIGAMDALIAATAIEWDLTIATRDKDFQRVAGLKVELWR